MSAQLKEVVNESGVTIAACPADMIDLLWDRVEPLLQMVIDRAPDDIVAEVVKDRLAKGHQLLVTIARGSELIAINVLDVKTLDSGIKVLYIPIVAGECMDEWMDEFLVIAKKIAKDYDCKEMRGMAVRKGWMAKLKPYGWEEMFTTVRCKLGE